MDEMQKIILEYYGDFWHCNPKVYKDPDFYHKAIHSTVREKWQYDSHRKKVLENAGYKVYVIWESDFLKSKNEIFKYIKNIISENINETCVGSKEISSS